jgi:tetratricopeptide (TPR) repeat protein
MYHEPGQQQQWINDETWHSYGRFSLMELNEALTAQESVLGVRHKDTGRTSYLIGRSLLSQRLLQDSIRYFRNALEVQDAVLGWYHESTCATCYWLGHAWMNQGEFIKAQRAFKRIELAEKERSRKDLVSLWRNTLAFVSQVLDQTPERPIESWIAVSRRSTGINYDDSQEIVKPSSNYFDPKWLRTMCVIFRLYFLMSGVLLCLSIAMALSPSQTSKWNGIPYFVVAEEPVRYHHRPPRLWQRILRVPVSSPRPSYEQEIQFTQRQLLKKLADGTKRFLQETLADATHNHHAA